MGLFVHFNYYRKSEGYDFTEEVTGEVMLNDSSALAPHGVPSTIGRSISRQNFGATAQNNGVGDVTTPSNRLASPSSHLTAASWNDSGAPAASKDYYDPNEAWS